MCPSILMLNDCSVLDPGQVPESKGVTRRHDLSCSSFAVSYVADLWDEISGT